MGGAMVQRTVKFRQRGATGNGIKSVSRTYAISAQGTTVNDTAAPAIYGTWSSSSPAVTEAYPYLWAKEIVVYTDDSSTTRYYCVGGRGANGVDAQDIEWVYVRTTENVQPVIVAESGNGYLSDDYKPLAKVTSGRIKGGSEGNANVNVRCTDDPQGVDSTWKYEWEIKREKGTADANGHRAWVAYSGSMTLHNRYVKDITSADIMFCLGDSQTQDPGDSSFTVTTFAGLNISSTDANKFVWQCIKTTYTSGNPTFSGKVCLGKVSDFASVVEQFALGSASAATSSWRDNTPPSAENGKYLWTRTKLTYSGGGTTYIPSEAGQCIGYFGEDGDDAVTYQIVFTEAWAKVDASNVITARLRGNAYKIVGSTRTTLSNATIRIGYILTNSNTYVDTTTNSNGYFTEEDWFNGDAYGASGYSQGSQSIFAAIIVGTAVKCVEYVTMTLAGAKGDTGRMYYIAGKFPEKAPYTRTAKLCPVVYYSPYWWYLDADSATGSDTPSDSNSSKWKKLENYGVVLTDAIFVKNFAQFGAAIITGDWLISVHGTINGVYYGGSVEAPGEYNNRAAYTYFDPAYPMGFESFQIPVKTEEIDQGYSTEWIRITNNFSLTAGTYIIRITCHVNSSDTMHLRLFDDNDSSDAYYLGSTTSDEVVTLVYTKTITTGSSKFNLRAGMNANGEIGYIDSIEIESTDARFIPNYAVDLRTGRTYQNDANIRGKIVTIGPSSKVEISDGVIKLYGAYSFPNIVLGVDANGCAVLNFYDKNGMFTYGLGPIEAERTQSQAESFTLQYYNIDDGSYDATEIPNSAIVTVYRYMFKSQVPPSSTFLKKYLAKIMANAYFGGNYCASGEDARYFNGKFIKDSYHSPFQTGDVYGGGIVVTCNNPQSGIISSKETMLNGRSIEELELRGYNVMQDSDYNRTKEGDVYYYNTKDPYSPVQAFWLDTSAGGSKGYGSGYTWFGYINLIVDPTDWNEDKLADPIYWFNLQYIDSKGVGSYKTLYINKSKLQAILQNAGYSL